MGDITSIVKYVLLGIDILFILTLLIHILKGYKKGLLKTSVIVGTKLIPLIFLLIFATPIARSLINKEMAFLPDSSSLFEFVKVSVADSMFDGDMEALLNAQMHVIIEAVLVMAVSFALFLVVTILTFIILSPILRLICKLTIPFFKNKKPKKLFKILGAAVGGVGYIILFVLLFLPIYGAVETAQVVVNEVATFDEEFTETKDMVNDTLDGSFILKFTSTVGKKKDGKFGLAAKTFGSRTAIHTEYGKINIIKELDNLGKFLPRALELVDEFSSDKTTNQKIACITNEDIDALMDYLSNSNIIKVVYPIGINVLENKAPEIEFFEDMDIDFEEVAKVDIQGDLSKSKELLKKALLCVKSMDLDNVTAASLLENEVLLDNIDDIIDIAFNLEITDKFLSKILISYLDNTLEEQKLSHLVGLIDNTYLKEGLGTDFKTLVEAYKTLDEIGMIDYFTSEEEKTLEVTAEFKDKLEIVIEKIFNLKLLENHEKKLVQTVFMFTEFDKELLDEMLEENINWGQELDNVGDIVIDVLELIIVAKLDQSDYESLLTNDEVTTILTTIIDKAFKMQLSDKYFAPLLVQYIDDFLKENNLEDFVGIIDATYLKEDFTDDFTILVDNFKILKEIGILDYFKDKEANPLEFTTDVKNKLDASIKGILSLKLVEGNEKAFIAKILSFIPEDMNVNIDGLLEENYNWNSELSIMGEVVVEAIHFMVVADFDSENLTALLSNNLAKERMPILIDKVFELECSEKYIAPILVSYVHGMCDGTSFEEFKNYITVSYLKNHFSSDIEKIFDVYTLTEELKVQDHFDKENDYKMDIANPEVEAKFKNMLNMVLSLHAIDGNEEHFIRKIVEITDTGDWLRVDEIDFTTIDWDSESPKIANVVTEFVKMEAMNALNLDNYLDEDNYDEIALQYGKTFDAMISCNVTKDFAFRLLNTLVTDAGYTITFSEEQKAKIIENTAVYEFDVLTTVAKDAQSIFADDENGEIDYTTVKGSDVTRLMLEASEGVVASAIMGSTLNEALGPDGIDMMPVDEVTGLPKYDFTNQTVLKEQAETVGNSFDLFNTMKDVDMDNITSENIYDIVENITSLDSENVNTEFIEDVLNTVTNEEVTIPDDIDWSKEADIVKDVLNEYQNSTDKDNFNIDDYPELSDSVNNSDIAKSILDYLGISVNP